MTNKWKKKYISFPSFLPTLCSSSSLVLSISVPYLSLHLSLFLQLLLSFFSLPSFPFNFSFALFSHFSPLLSLFLLIFLFFPHLVTFPLHSDLISFHSLPHSPFTIYLSVMWKCPPFASISSFCLLTLSFSSFSSSSSVLLSALFSISCFPSLPLPVLPLPSHYPQALLPFLFLSFYPYFHPHPSPFPSPSILSLVLSTLCILIPLLPFLYIFSPYLIPTIPLLIFSFVSSSISPSFLCSSLNLLPVPLLLVLPNFPLSLSFPFSYFLNPASIFSFPFLYNPSWPFIYSSFLSSFPFLLPFSPPFPHPKIVPSFLSGLLISLLTPIFLFLPLSHVHPIPFPFACSEWREVQSKKGQELKEERIEEEDGNRKGEKMNSYDGL